MPSQILHTLFGEDLFAAICRPLNGAGVPSDSALRSAFALGCQGPDIFYHSQRLRPVALEYGSLLHRRDYGIFAASLLKAAYDASPEGIGALGWYALGFMTHAALDRACHPYIVYKSLDLHANGSVVARCAHPFFERILDVLMLKELRSIDAAAWDQEKLLAAVCENPPPGIKALIAAALVAAFGDRAGKDEKLSRRIDNAFADSAHYYYLSAPARTVHFIKTQNESSEAQSGNDVDNEDFPRSIRFLSLVFPENLSMDIDFLNMRHSPWYYPYTPPLAAPQQQDTRSFPDIYHDALNSAAAAFTPCVNHYLAGGGFSAAAAIRVISDAAGNSSLSIQDREGKPVAPNTTDPLPLGEALIQQAKMRGINTTEQRTK